MKKLRHLCCILISCLLLGGLPFGAAAGENGFDLVPFMPEEEARIRKNCDKDVRLTDVPAAAYMSSFAVREDGWFAIDFMGKQVDVFNEDGEFQYGITFSQNPIRVDWDGDNVLIARIRGAFVATVNSQGKVEKIMDIRYGNGDPYWRILEKYEQEVNGTTYRFNHSIERLERRRVLTQIDQFVRIEPDGTETVLVDVSSKMAPFMKHLWIICPILFVLGAIIAIFRAIDEWRTGQEKTNT